MAYDLDTVGTPPGSFQFPLDDIFGIPDQQPTIPAGAESGVPAGISDVNGSVGGNTAVQPRHAAHSISVRNATNQPLFWSAVLIAFGYALIGIASYVESKA